METLHGPSPRPIGSGNENQLNAYGYQLMGQGRMDKAQEMFTLNVERHPDSWNPHDSLAECYAKMGVPASDQANHDRITKTTPPPIGSATDRVRHRSRTFRQ